MNSDKKLHKKKLEDCFKKFSKNTLLIDIKGKKTTYNEFFINTLNLIDYFRKKNIKKGSKILILSENCSNYLLLLSACILGGYVACPADPSLKTDKIQELKKIYKIEHTIKDLNKLSFNKTAFDSLLIDYKDTDCLIIGSSGTTGAPKGILFTSNSILKSAQSFSKLANYDDKTRILHCLPMFYMGGILDTFFACLFSGSTIVLDKRFSIANVLNFWDLPKKMNCNFLFLTPSIIAAICAVYKPQPTIKKHVEKYKSIFATGSYLYPEIREKFYKLYNKKIFACYGVTELGGPLAIQKSEDTFLEFCVGSSSPDVKISIKNDKDGSKMVLIKSPFFMKGYLTKEGIKAPKSIDGYYDTGDIGDYKDGLLFIKGRKRDVIKKGGELISLALIENTALKNESVLEAAAIGKKDTLSGEDLYLILTIKGKFSLDKKIKEIRSFLSNKLRPIEMPKKIILTSKMPKTNSGKILKNSLLKLFEL